MNSLIINFNRLTLTKNTADWCACHGLFPIIIDNNSDYEPLLDYYTYDCPYLVYRLKENRGHKVISTLDLSEFGIRGRYIVTDPDLDFTGIPSDFLDVLHEGLNMFSTYMKCGFSLELNDLPDSPEGNFIRDHAERSYWKRPLGNLYFDAYIDTTFALYREGYQTTSVRNSLRTNRPYTAKHVPWYYTDFNKLPADEQYYYKTANDSASGKKRLLKCV